MPTLVRIVRALPLILISPVLLIVVVLAIAVTDLVFALFGRKRADAADPISLRAASVVIPNWNGRDLLEKYIPSIETALAITRSWWSITDRATAARSSWPDAFQP
jgi:hypothetical protein